MAEVARLTSTVHGSDVGWTLVADERDWNKLMCHLFPGDDDEHGAILLSGAAQGRRGPRLLVRDVLLARDGEDYVPGQRGYRALDPQFIAAAARRARDEGWIYLAAHNHGGVDSVAFSSIDLQSHERGYPSLMQITGQPAGGLVLAHRAIAGDLWFPDGGRAPLARATVLGRNVTALTPYRRPSAGMGPETFDRQARLFGSEGQELLSTMRVGVVGLGGAGSMAAAMLARLGVRELVLIDPDRIEESNLSRVVGSTREDLGHRARTRLMHFGRGRGRPSLKVDISARSISAMGLATEVIPTPSSIADRAAAQLLCTCDWIVLAADSQEARHIVNAIVHAFMIPAVQVGVKVPVNPATGEVGDIFAVSRRVLPSSGCLWCNGLVDPTELQLEAIGDEGARARAYVGPDAPAPSVITLNGLAVSAAMTDLMLSATGLLLEPAEGAPAATYLRFLPRTGRSFSDEPRADSNCPYCGDGPQSIKARGDDAQLPLPLRVAPTGPRRRRGGFVRWTRNRYDR